MVGKRTSRLVVAKWTTSTILNSYSLRVTWNGGNGTSDIEIESLNGEHKLPASSHFGSGIITWNLPLLFRTSPGYNLQVRGPANWPKDGAYPLEGIVATGWLEFTFTMNWKLTRANLPVIFEAGEPICMIVPQRRGELETFAPQIRDIGEDRERFNRELDVSGSEAQKRGWPLLAATIGAFEFMLSSLWATLQVTFVGVPESDPEDEAEELADVGS